MEGIVTGNSDGRDRSSMSRLRHIAALAPTVLLARRNVSRATARSTLAVVAVVIGVVAVGAIGTGGEAFKQNQVAAYEGFGGTATVHPVVYPEAEDPNRNFSDAEVTRMRRAAEGATVIPVVQPFGSLVRTPAGETVVTAQVKGIEDPGTFYETANGSVPENWRRSVIVGSRIAADNDIEPGDQMTVVVEDELEGTFPVAAVLRPQGFADPLSADQSIFVPISRFDDATYDEVIVRVDPSAGSVARAATDIETEFNSRRRTVSVQQVQQQREQFEQSFETVNQFLIGVGAISLLVAGVTIANTLLMSVIEREGEIGVLRAVGYTRGAVVRMLVAEATILGIIGGVIGVPIALGIGAVINVFLVGDPLAFTRAGLQYVGIGCLFGIATALVAGVYPAWKAANKRPAEAFD
ncbi:ABC transporter permease [Halomicroarcula sp. GCM10025710]